MLKEYPPDMPWAIVHLKNQSFGVAAQHLREMALMPEVTGVPNVPDYIRGVINLRGQVLPLVDLRRRLGMISAAEEIQNFCAMLEQREQDHRNWLAELEASVGERRVFKLTTDPHKCAFGKWYDAYKADNMLVDGLLKKFDAPHKNIHAVGVEAAALVTTGAYDQAEALIERTRSGVLSRMITLFSELRLLVKEAQREIALILTGSERTFAVSVDSVSSVEKLSPGTIEPLPEQTSMAASGLVHRVGRRAKNNALILIIETDEVLNHVLAEKAMNPTRGEEIPVLAGA